MVSDTVTTFGVFNKETKELFRFGEDYQKALFGYMDIIKSEMRGFTFPDEWYLVFMQDKRIVQFEQLEFRTQSKIVQIDETFNVHN